MNRADEFTRKLRKQRNHHLDQADSNPITPLQNSVDEVAATQDQATREDTTDSETHLLPLEQIVIINPQHRKHIDLDAIRELANQINKVGLYNPILVRPVGPQQYELVQGERRYRAYQMLFQDASDDPRWRFIRATVRKIDDFEKSLAQLAENIQREEMRPLEEAHALLKLKHDYQAAYGKTVTMQSLGELIGKNRTWISRRLALLSKPPEIQQALISGELTLEQAAKVGPGGLDSTQDNQRHTRIQSVVHIDLETLQGSVKTLAKLAKLLDLPGIEIPTKAARKDYIVAFELRAKEILNAAVQRLKSK